MEEESASASASALQRRGRSSNASSASASPEFEFWMVGNPSSFPPPQLLSADELFADGVLLPLRLLHPKPEQPEPQPEPQLEPEQDRLGAAADIAATPPSSGSKRWRDIFRVAGDKRAEDKDRRRDRKSGAGAGPAEIGINIWPFARSRSAGTAGSAAARARGAAPEAPGRKASSAPCSRSNSRGESSAPRRWAASPGRAGVHVGRSSPVWQVRRAGKGGPEPGHAAAAPARDRVAGVGGGGGGKRTGGPAARVALSLNVNTCIGYRSHVSCRGDATERKKSGGDATPEEATVAGNGNGNVNGNGNGGLFNLRNLFSSKKVY